MGSVVLDSSVFIRLERGNQDLAVALTPSDHILLPAAVLAELSTPIFDSNRSPALRSSTRSFVDSILAICEFAPADQQVATIYAELVAQAKTAGKPRSQNDLWIAATCISRDAELITFDRKAQLQDIARLRIRL